MNRHFQDTLYYLKRAGRTAKEGVSAEVDPMARKLRSLTGSEEEPEPTRPERVKAELNGVRERVASEASEAVSGVREAVGNY